MHILSLSSMSALQIAMSFSSFLAPASSAFTGPFPASYETFSSAFVQPPIPVVATELRGHYTQHKWDQNVSHIVAGYWYNSAANGKVRVDETYEGAFGSSLFDYTKLDASGGVLNKQYIVESSVGSKPSCFNDHVADPGFPLITADFLQNQGAVYGGLVQDPQHGWLQTWNILFGGSIPAIIYLDVHNVLIGYDFWGLERRTKVITRFFNIAVGKIDPKLFEAFPC